MQDLAPDHSEEELADQIDDAVPSRGYSLTPLVGLGGSAGAIAALQRLLPSVPTDCGLAFVVVLHLSREHESMLPELLQHCTAMRVVQVLGRTRVEPGTVYVIPPDKFLRSAGAHLNVVDRPHERGGRTAVDLFFRTLADTHGAHAAAVVLSGGDGDGAIGIKRIKERGGLTIAQDPLEAEHGSMPESAIATEMVDWVLPVAEIGQRLRTYFQLEERLRLPPEVAPPSSELAPADVDENTLREVLTFLHTRTGTEFSCYKRATVLRRIGRRMQVNGVETLADYLGCLRTRPGEVSALRQDLLISVTNFFRDAECFHALDAHIPELFRGKGPGDAVRVWVTACATGEEAYSIAMLLSEHARRLAAPPTLQVFATDLDAQAVKTAREALYPAIIEADVSEDRLRRFFTREKGGYRVRREVREMVLFAVHDLLADAPFSRVDLASCRNLLIYLNPEAQTRAFEVFAFALQAHGRLFLGTSETVDPENPHFSVIDRKHRLYAKRADSRAGLQAAEQLAARDWPRTAAGAAAATPVIAHHAREPGGPVRDAEPPFTPRRSPAGGAWGELHLKLLERLGPPSILVDADHDIVHLSASAGRYLQHSAGEPTRNLLRLVPSDLRIDLRAALYKAHQTGLPVETDLEGYGGRSHDGRDRFAMRVVPVRDGSIDLALVLLGEPQPQPALELRATGQDPVAHELDQEIDRLKDQLRSTVDEYEGSAQELKASNEELQAINEELRSATEELETSREELQSINEELTTVNHELKAKVDELAHSNSDMQNLMNATAIATIFLDRDLRIARYTPMAVTLFNFIPGDIGRPLSDLTPKLQYPELTEDAARVLGQLAPLEREVGLADGSWFLARLLPYRTMEDHIAGVVLSFINITERKRAEEVSQWLSAVVASSMDAIISFSLEGTVLSWNSGAHRVFGYAPDEMVGQPIALLADAERTDEARWVLEQIARGQSVENLDTVGRGKTGEAIHVAMTASPITNAEGAVVGGTASLRDIGDAKRSEEALRRSEERLRLVIENARDYAIFSTDGSRTITSWNHGAERLLGYTEAEALGRPGDMIFTPEDREAGAPEREALTAMAEERAADERMHQRKDGSRFWASGMLMRMHDSTGGAIGFVKILRDETQSRKARAALQHSQAELLQALKDNEQARAQLEKADVAKDRFLAVLSHELRNPLAAVMNASAMLLGQDALPAEAARAAAVVQRQGRTMKALLDDLLDVSRLALGRLELRIEEVALAPVVDAALETVQAVLQTAGHRLRVRLPDAGVRLRIDPLRISQVLVNLLTNAAKYTPPGGDVALDVRVDEDLVWLSVSDSGVGIPADAIERMFELYTQGPETAHALNDGLGVGLALVRTIVALHGGTVSGESAGPGRGSRFTVGLPRATSEVAVAPPSPAEAPARQLKILVADDNEDAGWALAQLLQRVGHRTVLANTGTQALMLALEETPDAAVLDLGMPDMDGVEVARRLRATPQGQAMALVALTGWGGEANRARALAEGFDALLSKPAELPLLLATLAQVMADRAR